ncbi:response regulator transcription factor [Paenibacillus caseinilyticus]|uniref:Regulator n=1 Tax=Paenibacillus mucilaginosus K02 TaxID=997761 RepID=I0BU69_9BACL|nr:response regulator transcription factor [Paenibacillus mucilaginosus]AFH65916.1 regulator [Paenibacillus mucilaginosus K02]
MKPIHTFICEDDPLFLELLSEYIGSQPDIEVTGTASRKPELIQAVGTVPMDVLLLDLNLSDENYDGIEAAIEIKAMRPDLQIIVLSSLDQEEVMTHAVAYGRVTNYITKEHYADVPSAIRSAAAGRSGLHHSSAGVLMNRLVQSHQFELKKKITPVQLQIMQMLDQGYSRREIAEKLYYNEQSVNNELCKASRTIKGKFPYLEWLRLKKHNTKHLVELAKQLGLLEPSPELPETAAGRERHHS